MRLQVNQILNAVKAVVPEQMWGDTVQKLDQPEQHHALDVEADDLDDDEDAYDPTEFAEDDDELWADDDGEAGYYDGIDGVD